VTRWSPRATTRIESAMVLAAGRGERLRPLTENCPKPLLEVRGRSMLDRVLDNLARVGVRQAVVNSHHFGHMIEAALAGREAPKTLLSPEEILLDTGGGVRRALAKLGDKPFYVINGDVLWLDGRVPALQRLARNWDDARTDALLLLHPTAFAFGYDGAGDFMMTPDGTLRRRREREVAPFAFTGIQILHPRLFEGAPDGAFSLNRLYDKAAEAGRLRGLRHDGEWFHIGTVPAYEAANSELHFLAVHAVHR